MNIDSAKALIYKSGKIDSTHIQTYFYIADEYMDQSRYDSAQSWLNIIHEFLPTKSTSINNYFLISRQAEVYYYNNLLQLGLEESHQLLNMAISLNDSLLIADSYNFIGLFLVSIDSTKNSINYFLKGLKYIKQPPYPNKYLELSLPHHLYGNLAEAYQKLKLYDSSLFYSKKSLIAAKQINQKRGAALAYIGMADAFFEMGYIDSARLNYLKGDEIGNQNNYYDIKLLCLIGNAKCNNAIKNFKSMEFDLKNGLELLKTKPSINRLYALIFLNSAIPLLKIMELNKSLITALEIKSKLDNDVINEGNSQLSFIVQAGMINEKRLINLQIQEAQRKQQLANTRLILAIVIIIILVISFLVYRYYQKQVMTISKVRNNISQDLHDEVGASISSLQIYGTVAEQLLVSNPSRALEMIQKIQHQSRDIMETMSDIVWSMKSNEKNNTTLETKIKNYAVSGLQESKINFSIEIQAEAELCLSNVKARRNILMIIRELMNNTLKHSKASQFHLFIYIKEENWIMEISDNGIGFQEEKILMAGNGLNNIKKRCSELNGTYFFQSTKGTNYFFIFPIQIISNQGW
jgi:signal transduction histidine kinase